MCDDVMFDVVEFCGVDDFGCDVGMYEVFWVEVVKKCLYGVDGSKLMFYVKGIEYWDGVVFDVDGVFGGFVYVSVLDVWDNVKLLEDLWGRG